MAHHPCGARRSRGLLSTGPADASEPLARHGRAGGPGGPSSDPVHDGPTVERGPVRGVGRARRVLGPVAVLVGIPVLAAGATGATQADGPAGSTVIATVEVLPAEGSSTGGNAVSAALALEAALDEEPARRAAARAVTGAGAPAAGTGRGLTDDLDRAISVRHPDNSALVTVTYAGSLGGPTAVTVVRAVIRAGIRQVYAPALTAAQVRVSAAATAASRALTESRAGAVAPAERLRAVLDEQQRLTTQIALTPPRSPALTVLRARVTRADADAARLAPLVAADDQLVSDRRDLVEARTTAAASAASVAGRLSAATADTAIGLDGPVSGGRPTLRRSLVVAAAGGLAVAVLALVGWDLVRARRRVDRR